MQNESNDKINASGDEIKKYIKNMPDNLIGKISIVNDEIAYDINKFSKEEQVTLKSDYGFKAYGDNIAPYGSIEKKAQDGKVEITVFSADDESDIDEIILPDGTSKKIQYDTENILLRGRIFKYEGISQAVLNQYFKNVTVDEKNEITDISEVTKYNVIMDLNAYADPLNYEFLNSCFEIGKNLITSGNDSTKDLSIVESSFHTKKIDFYTQLNTKNELTRYIKEEHGRDSISSIKFKENTKVWSVAKFEDNETDALGLYESEKGNRWLHNHLCELKDAALFYRNAIYRVTGSRSATYEANKNGTCTFTIKDLAGNLTEISIDVTEL